MNNNIFIKTKLVVQTGIESDFTFFVSIWSKVHPCGIFYIFLKINYNYFLFATVFFFSSLKVNILCLQQ